LGHFRWRFLLVLVFISGIAGTLTGQNTRSVQKVNAIEPFIKADEVHIQQDSRRNLWITTPVKILKYNSGDTEVFNKFMGIPKEVGGEYLETYTDSQGNVWLAGSAGIAVLENGQSIFRFVSGVTGKIYALREDAGNQLWIAAENGVYKLNTNSEKDDFGLSRFLSENTMAAGIVLHGNQIVFAGPNGVLTIDRKSGKFNKIDMGYYQNLQITSILSLSDAIIFGTKDSGLYKTDPDFKKFQRAYLPYEVSSSEITSLQLFNQEIIVSTRGAGVVVLNNKLELLKKESAGYPNNVYATCLDNQSLLWMVSNKGLYLQNFSGNVVANVTHDPAKYSSLGDDFVTASEKDSEGNLWVGTAKGLSIWNPETDRWRHIENLNYTRNIKDPDKITDMASVDDHMWIATADDGVYKVNIHTLLRAHYSVDALYKTPIQAANAVFIDGHKNIWIGGKDGYLTQIKPDNTLKSYPIKNVEAISELGPKQLIVATKSRVHSLNPYTGRITDLTKLTAKANMVYYGMNDLQITNQGIGLFATEGAGLILYDFDRERTQQLSTSDGLPSNNILGVDWEHEGAIWITTDNGLAYYDQNTKDLRLFSELNGLSTNEITTGITKLRKEDLMFGSTKGLNIFKPKELLAQQEFKPELTLEKMILPSKTREEAGKIDLAGLGEVEIQEEAAFQLKFRGRSNLDPEGIEYSWKLAGFDDDWTKPTKLNSVSYASLPPGDYTFMVRYRISEGGWSNPKLLDIRVADTGGTISTVYLFMGISVLAMIAIFVIVFVKRSRSADRQAKAELREKLKQEFGKPVESAVHSLSKISEAAENSPEDLQRYAARFDDLFRQILNFNYEESVYEISKIDMHKHLSVMLKDMQPLFEDKKLEFSINDQWGEEAFFYNLEVLDKIIFGLVSASAQYCHEHGKIIVNLIETSVGDLKLQITDNGRGVPESHQRTLDRMTSMPKGRKYRDANGLASLIQARELAQNSGGSFSYDTEKNEGSTFTVILKNRKQDYRKVPSRAAQLFLAEKQKKNPKTKFPKAIANYSDSKILVIENDAKIRELLLRNIGKYCQVYQAATAEEGMEKAGMIFPDIIISASVLPDMNAFQLSKMLKRNIGLNHINIFMIADGEVQLSEEQLDGFSEVIRKPIDVNLLLTKISEKLAWQQQLRSNYVKAYVEDKTPEFRSANDEKFIQNLGEIILENIKNENFTVHDLSAAVGISSNALFMKLKNLVNLSPQDFMEFTRLNYARELMDQNEYNSMEVAYKSGFSSPKLFYSSFKKFYGYSPTGSVDKSR